jgi:hypothetical protein
MTKIAGSGSISQRHGSADPDPDPDAHHNVMDPQHWYNVVCRSDDVLAHEGDHDEDLRPHHLRPLCQGLLQGKFNFLFTTSMLFPHCSAFGHL